MVTHLKSAWSSMSSLFVPIFLRKGFTYTAADFRADLIAGITVAIVQIPQAMALALLAGLPAIYGLYASLPGWIAGMWGSSRQLSTGPVAIVSLLTFTSLVPLAEPGSTAFIQLAAILALLVGMIYMALGVFRLGFLVRAVPNSVIAGFATSAATIIVLSQIPTLLGISIPRHDLIIQDVVAMLGSLSSISIVSALIGAAALAFLLFAKRLPKSFPSALVVVAGGIGFAFLFDASAHGVALVTPIPPGLPSFSFPALSFAQILALLPNAAVIALVGFVETHAIAKTAGKSREEALDTDQELVGQGLANMAAGFLRGYPLSGSFTRTAINRESGAHTQIASVITAIVTVCAILFLSGILSMLPRAVLAAIVIAAALSLIDIKGLRHMLKISRPDGLVAGLTAGLALILRPDEAILIGIIAALLLFIRETVSNERVTEMGVDRDWNILRAAIAEEKVETIPGTCIVRLGMSLYYANTEYLLSTIDGHMAAHAAREQVPVRILTLDMASVHFIDITGLEALESYLHKLHDRKIVVCMMYLRGPVRESLTTAGALNHVHILHNISELKRLVDAGPNAMLL